jgi:DNA-directed RNA polymerase sigma subunit (sigma70/sigma32)
MLSGLSKEEAKNKVQKETSEKISKSNKIYAEKNQNPRKGMIHTDEAKEKNRLAHLGKTLSDSAKEKLSETIKEQFEKGERKSVLAKLTDDQVLCIRDSKGIVKQKKLSEMFNISIQTVSAIQNNLVYKHVKPAI